MKVSMVLKLTRAAILFEYLVGGYCLLNAIFATDANTYWSFFAVGLTQFLFAVYWDRWLRRVEDRRKS